MVQLAPQSPANSFLPALPSPLFLSSKSLDWANSVVLNLTLALTSFSHDSTQTHCPSLYLQPSGVLHLGKWFQFLASLWSFFLESSAATSVSLRSLTPAGFFLGYWPSPKDKPVNELGSHCFPVYPNSERGKTHFPFGSSKEIRIPSKRISTKE